jgi:hypothetical protein
VAVKKRYEEARQSRRQHERARQGPGCGHVYVRRPAGKKQPAPPLYLPGCLKIDNAQQDKQTQPKEVCGGHSFAQQRDCGTQDGGNFDS